MSVGDFAAGLFYGSSAGGASPSDTYTRQQIDAKLKEKADKAEVTALETVQSAQEEAVRAVAEQAALNLASIGMQSKNLIKITVSNGSYYGIDINNTDGTVTVSGSNTRDIQATISLGTVRLKHGYSVILNGCPLNGSLSSYALQLRYNDKVILEDIGDGSKSVTINSDGEYDVILRIAVNYTIDNILKFQPMLRYAEITDDTYEPYHPSLQEQINRLTARLDAAGITANAVLPDIMMDPESFELVGAVPKPENKEETNNERTENL